MFRLPQRSGSIKGRIKAKTIFSNVVFISNFESILIKASFGPDENFFDIFYASIYSTSTKKVPLSTSRRHGAQKNPRVNL